MLVVDLFDHDVQQQKQESGVSSVEKSSSGYAIDWSVFSNVGSVTSK